MTLMASLSVNGAGALDWMRADSDAVEHLAEERAEDGRELALAANFMSPWSLAAMRPGRSCRAPTL